MTPDEGGQHEHQHESSMVSRVANFGREILCDDCSLNRAVYGHGGQKGDIPRMLDEITAVWRHIEKDTDMRAKRYEAVTESITAQGKRISNLDGYVKGLLFVQVLGMITAVVLVLIKG